MEIENLEKILSASRLQTYYNLFPNDKLRAIQYYQLNAEISETFYNLLANFEIALRNSIHHSFSIRFKTVNWFDNIPLNDLQVLVEQAKQKILRARGIITVDKVVAELTFGFWTSLFNKQYAKIYWRPLMFVFPNLDKKSIQRDKIAFKINQVRKFRNRIFHYEPICNDLIALKANHEIIVEVLNWLDKDIYSWIGNNERFETLFKKAQSLR